MSSAFWRFTPPVSISSGFGAWYPSWVVRSSSIVWQTSRYSSAGPWLRADPLALRGESRRPRSRPKSSATNRDALATTQSRRQRDRDVEPAAFAVGEGDPAAVVDSRLRVRGVASLRVADASIMPEVVNAPTHATCVAIGEKCADLISGR